MLGIAGECGRRGVKALVMISSGLDRPGRAELLGICRGHGMRLVGPDCSGVANTSITRQALFEQAGVIATANFGELLDAVTLLASQPVPTGGRVAVVSNTRGGGILAADACDDAGRPSQRCRIAVHLGPVRPDPAAGRAVLRSRCVVP
ncbi:MAG: hypothetical protein ACLQB1_05625 [Streptosporangiaceae bacterium]